MDLNNFSPDDAALKKYYDDVTNKLNNTDPSVFTPSLADIDALLASITIH